MTQDQKQIQSQQQLQTLLKDTLKENKTLVSKNTKLQNKYVELFKEHKLLRKDHTTFTIFFANYYLTEESSRLKFIQNPLGQLQQEQMQKLAQEKEQRHLKKIQELEKAIKQKEQNWQREMQLKVVSAKEKLIQKYEQQLTNLREITSEESNSLSKQVEYLNRQLETIKKNLDEESERSLEYKIALDIKINQISKLSIQKLKIQHQINILRKKQMADQLTRNSQIVNRQSNSQINQFLFLRQQVESLLLKKDQLKQEIKQKQQIVIMLTNQINQLKSDLIKIKTQLTPSEIKQEGQMLIDKKSNNKQEELDSTELCQTKQNEQIQREYLRNILIQYIKAQINGSMQQALTLLEVVGNIVKLDYESAKGLERYMSRRRQWWFIKY